MTVTNEGAAISWLLLILSRRAWSWCASATVSLRPWCALLLLTLSLSLLLLSLVLALRCVLDPWDISYYALPFLFALTTWEVLGARRLPVVSLLATFATWFIFMETGNTALYLPANTQALIFTLVSVPGVLALALTLYAPALARRLIPAIPATDPVPTAA